MHVASQSGLACEALQGAPPSTVGKWRRIDVILIKKQFKAVLTWYVCSGMYGMYAVVCMVCMQWYVWCKT